jgi:hypothetical protein
MSRKSAALEDVWRAGVPYDFFEAMECEPVQAIDLYTDMFRLGDGFIQRNGEKGNLKANPIAYYRNDREPAGHFRIMFEDEFDEILLTLQEADFAILNGITYFGRRNEQAHASKMYSLIFDLDGITEQKLRNFFKQCAGGVIPSPNYIVLSGHGLHLYYIFEQPLSLFPNIKLQVKELKYALTRRIWNKYTSTLDEPQYQGINQGFRVAGGKTKKGCSFDYSVVFRYRKEFFSMAELNQFVPKDSQIDEQKIFKESKYTLEDAKKRFPEWYERVVLQKERTVKKWDISGKVHGDNPFALYEWWLSQIRTGATFGHRYFCVMMLAIYAVKCDVPKERLDQDAADLVPYLNSLGDEPFTAADVESALECYDDRYATFPLRDIEKLSAIEIPRNKRNGRSQAVHMQLMQAQAAKLREIGETTGWGQDGRPSNERKVMEWREKYPSGTRKECAAELGITERTVRKWWGAGECCNVVYEWRVQHPEGRKAACVRDTGLSKPTVYKWWEYDPSSITVPELELPTDLIPDPDWHTELPEYYVVDGAPDMMERMLAYMTAGVRSVEILSKDEYEYLLQKGSETVTFAESEVTEEIKSQAAKHGVTLNIVPDEQYQTDLVMGWLASISDDTDNTP